MSSKPEDIEQRRKDFLKEKEKVIKIIEQPELKGKLEAIKASTENPTIIQTLESQLKVLRDSIDTFSVKIQMMETGDQHVIEYLKSKQRQKGIMREADEIEGKIAQEKIKHREEIERRGYVFHKERNVVLNSPCKKKDYESKIKVKSKKDNLDLVCSETSEEPETYRYRHVGNPGDPNTERIDSKISEEMKAALDNNQNLPKYFPGGHLPYDVNKIARRIAIKAYEEGVSNGDPKTHPHHRPVTVSSEDRKWILNGDRHGHLRGEASKSYTGPISRMDGLLKRDLMKKTYGDGGIAEKFIHRSAQENEKIRDSVHKAAYYRSTQGLDLQAAPAPEGDNTMPKYTKQQFVTDEMVEGWNPETKDYVVWAPEEKKQRYIESLEFKGLRELKQLAESLNVEQIPDEIDELQSEPEREEARKVLKDLIMEKYSEMEQGDESGGDESEEDAFGGGGKSKKRRKSKKHKSKRRKSKRRKSKRRKTRRNK